MNKRLLAASLVGALIFAASAPMQGCYGSFALTQKLYNWNGKQGDKWINSIIMVALYIGPYEVAWLADALAFNTAEFWSGTNPVTMGSSDRETRIVSVGGKTFTLTATKNHIELIPSEKGSETVNLVFEPDQKAWFVLARGGKQKIAEQSGDVLTLLYPDGHQEQLTR
jgi:hypothetical protein